MEFKSKLKSSRIIHVPISSIKPNSAQPRKYFDKDEIEKIIEHYEDYFNEYPLNIIEINTGIKKRNLKINWR
mgnify:CR=1 FL=1